MAQNETVSLAEFARLCGVSRPAIQKAYETGKLDAVKKNGRWAVKPSGPKSLEYYHSQLLKGFEPEERPTPQDGSEYNIETVDLRLATKADIDKFGALEKARKTKDERLAKRKELVERRLVQVVFGKLYAIDKNEFLTLGDKLAPDIASLAGINDPEIILAVGTRIEEECYKVLNHIQRIMNDFLEEQGGEAIE